MFIEEEYQDYKYLVEAHDNYFILSKSRSIHGTSGDADTIDCIYKYINPSILTVTTNYTSEQTQTFADVSTSFTDNIFDRADFPLIFVCNFIIVLIFVFVVNQLSKLYYKGGVFGPN